MKAAAPKSQGAAGVDAATRAINASAAASS
jgi:hypothetical protein